MQPKFTLLLSVLLVLHHVPTVLARPAPVPSGEGDQKQPNVQEGRRGTFGDIPQTESSTPVVLGSSSGANPRPKLKLNTASLSEAEKRAALITQRKEEERQPGSTPVQSPTNVSTRESQPTSPMTVTGPGLTAPNPHNTNRRTSFPVSTIAGEPGTPSSPTSQRENFPIGSLQSTNPNAIDSTIMNQPLPAPQMQYSRPSRQNAGMERFQVDDRDAARGQHAGQRHKGQHGHGSGGQGGREEGGSDGGLGCC